MIVPWTTPGGTSSLGFTKDVKQINFLEEGSSILKADQRIVLTERPVAFSGVPEMFAHMNEVNAGKNFRWGGDWSAAHAVSIQFVAAKLPPTKNDPQLRLGPPQVEPEGGLYQVHNRSNSILTYPDGSCGLHLYGDQNAVFYCHPTFASFQTKEYYIRLTVRRVGRGNAGMNLNYEVADSQGKTAVQRIAGSGLVLSKDTGWQTHTWHVTDACFSKMWGYDFNFRPENSAPFVIGKVEVSTVPFEK